MGGIVWIASYPGSGEHLMRLFLYAYAQLGDREIERIDLDSPGLAAAFTQENLRHWYEGVVRKPWAEATPADVAAARGAAQERIARAHEARVFAKTHNALVNQHGHPTINAAVSAKAIYIVRNPLDIAADAKALFGISDPDAAVRFLNNDRQTTLRTETHADSVILSWRRNVDSWSKISREGFHVLRYEDMARRPADAFGRALEFLGEPVETGRLRKAVALVRPHMDAARERLELGEEHIAELTSANRETMARFGYLPAAAG